MEQIKNKKGFSLIEMIVAVSLISALSLVLASFLVQSMKNYRLKKQSVELQEKAAHVTRDFEWQVRAADELLEADASELKFYRFFDLTSTSPTQVRFFSEGSQFKIGLTEPVGVEPNVTYPANNENIDLIVDNLVNSNSLFKYYDGNAQELTMPVNLANVRMVGLVFSLDRDTNLPPLPITESTKVMLRNMKDNL